MVCNIAFLGCYNWSDNKKKNNNNNNVSLKLGFNIYPTYLDGGSRPHLNHEVIQMAQVMTLAFLEAMVDRDYDVDDVLHIHDDVDLGLI